MSEMRQIAEKINNADAVLIGASNGLSITEGIHLFANNQAYQELFGDYQKKYGLPNRLSGMMSQWPEKEEMWGFWSRMVNHYSNEYEPSDVMKDLRAIIGDKDYFVVTSNGEQHFEKAGFDDDKVFEVEGDWLHMQCAGRCHEQGGNQCDDVRLVRSCQIHGQHPQGEDGECLVGPTEPVPYHAESVRVAHLPYKQCDGAGKHGDADIESVAYGMLCQLQEVCAG